MVLPADLASRTYGVPEGNGASVRATVAVLSSCNRHAFAELALRQIAQQSFPLSLLEVVVVDDADRNEPALVHRLRNLDFVRRLEWLRPWNNLTTSKNFSVVANFPMRRGDFDSVQVAALTVRNLEDPSQCLPIDPR